MDENNLEKETKVDADQEKNQERWIFFCEQLHLHVNKSHTI